MCPLGSRFFAAGMAHRPYSDDTPRAWIALRNASGNWVKIQRQQCQTLKGALEWETVDWTNTWEARGFCLGFLSGLGLLVQSFSASGYAVEWFLGLDLRQGEATLACWICLVSGSAETGNGVLGDRFAAWRHLGFRPDHID